MMKTFIYFVLLASMIACAHKTAVPVLADDPTLAAKQVQNLVPVGTPTAIAEQAMQRQGFRCSIKHGDFQDNGNVIKDVDYIDFYKTQIAGWPVQRRYWGALILTDGKVSGVRLSTGLVGP